MTAYPIATELSQAVLQARMLRGELRTPVLVTSRRALLKLSTPLASVTMPWVAQTSAPREPIREEVTRHVG